MIFLLLMALDCPMFVGLPEQMYAKVYYLHEEPRGLRYVFTTPVSTEAFRLVRMRAQGEPVAIEYWSRVSDNESFTLKKLCGTVPDPVFPLIFSDGFESGTTSVWNETVGALDPLIFADGFESGDLEAWDG